MRTQIDIQSIDEEKLLRIMRTLPPDRVSQLVDFARFLQSSGTRHYDALMSDEDVENDICDSEEKWDQLLESPQGHQTLLKMARKARKDFLAGRTTDIIITEDGRLAPE